MKTFSHPLLRYFRLPVLISVALLGGIFAIFGAKAFFVAAFLAILETTLSFDNAVVNAKVLQKMDAVWRHRFLTWGIFVAVFGARFALPILIVSVTAMTAPWDIFLMALNTPAEYANLLIASDIAIRAFGGMFLLMVSLKYFMDSGKTIHWVERVEKYLARLGLIESAEILIGLLILLGTSFAVATEHELAVLTSGLVGMVVFLFMEGITDALSLASGKAHLSGLALFLYLETLDVAFSLDGVVGAFALTQDIFIIAAGLGIGAYFVRNMTLYFVAHDTIRTVRYLEHGAHWAILGLALTMFYGLFHHVPEVVSGLIGLVFVAGSYYSSLRHMKK